MKYSSAILIMVLLSAPVFAQDQYTAVATEVTDNLYQINIDLGGMEVNTVALVGSDGLLLIDTGLIQSVETFKKALRSIYDGNPGIIINTHAHTDHTGGNAAFGSDPVIIAHEIVRTKLRTGSYLLLEFPDEALPDTSFTDEMTVHFNGEEIKIIAIPGAHDDNDAIVYFKKSKVLYTGDLFYAMMFPTLDGTSGNALNYAEAVGKMIELVPDASAVIPGHGRLATMDELKSFHEMLVQSTEIVKREYAQGKDLVSMQAENIIDQFDSFNYDLYKTTDGWIQDLYNALKGDALLQSLTEPLYWAIKKDGAKGAIALYKNLEKKHPTEYAFGPGPIYSVATDYLLVQERCQDAIIFYDFGLKKFPDWPFKWAFYEGLAEAHMKLGHNKQAIKNYKRSLELFPDNLAARAMIKELEKK